MKIPGASKDHKTLRELLRDCRLEIGVSQLDLANRLNVPQSFISKYESGERRLDLIELRAICLALGISLSSLLKKLENRLGAKSRSSDET